MKRNPYVTDNLKTIVGFYALTLALGCIIAFGFTKTPTPQGPFTRGERL